MVYKIEPWQYQERLEYPLDKKVELSLLKIKQFYEEMDGKVYVSFSGGKDSVVILHLVRSLYPDVVALFSDTGLEFPEIREFVQRQDNIVTVRPRRSFREVIEKYGYPVVSKNISMAVSRYRNTKDPLQKRFRKTGIKPDGTKVRYGCVSKKWWYLLDAPFKISEQCCEFLKKYPFNKFNRETGLRPYIGTKALDSQQRKLRYYMNGCNIFKEGKERSHPLMIWTDDDVWNYIKENKLEYCSIYDKGWDMTGCIYCMFGIQRDGEPNRFQRLKETHPKLYDYCINNLGIKEVMEYMGLPYE